MKLVVTEYISLDGVVENPEWIGPYFDDDFMKFKLDELLAADALLMGRGTYEYFAPVWVTGEPVEDSPGQDGFADRVHSLPKYIVSTTLNGTPWNNSQIIGADVVEEVARLKQQPGQDLLVAGSAQLVHTLMQHSLVDEVRFLMYPVVVGQGDRFFRDGASGSLKLIESRAFSTGVVALTYQPVR